MDRRVGLFLALLVVACVGERAPSPRGIVFVSVRPPEHEGEEIYIINPDGTGERRLTYSGDSKNSNIPQWAPDGTRIAFASNREDDAGRSSIYVMDGDPDQSEWVHEDTAALAFARAMAGEGVVCSESASEGKAELIADRDGLMILEDGRLETFNLIPGVMCAGRHGFSLVDRGFKLAGTRAIPLFLPQRDFEKAMAVLGEGPLFRVLPLRRAKVGILVTGTEVFQGLIKDTFIPTISHKIERFGSEVKSSLIVPDDRDQISNGIKQLIDDGADLIVTTAGLSVDPDDVTLQGLKDAGVEDMLYGMPILPGAMTLVARKGNTPVIGVPACALFYKTTSFDILLPRLLAGVSISRHDLERFATFSSVLRRHHPTCPGALLRLVFKRGQHDIARFPKSDGAQ